MGWLEDAIKKYWIDEDKNGINDKYDYGIGGDGTTDFEKNAPDGTPGKGKFDIDCSHLVYNILKEAGYNIKYRKTADMEGSGYYDVVTTGIKIGDIIYFPPSGNERYGHVGIVTEVNVTYDPTGKPIISGKFFGSQNKTGPAITDFGPDAVHWGSKRPIGTFLRPNPVCQPDAPTKPRVSQKVTRRDPLIFDLDGDGIETVGLNAGIHFDHDGNGFEELTGWVAEGDGMLMLDRNASGSLDNGSELFGDFTPLANGMLAVNGFQALAQFDTNGDGKIDANDPIWSQLKVWQHDPEATDLGDPDTSGKMSTLDELGIKAIYLDSTITNITDSSGNTETRTGNFEWTDGRQSAISEYRLQRDTSDAIPTEFLEVPPEVAVLPDLQGYGNVYSLHQAMVKDIREVAYV